MLHAAVVTVGYGSASTYDAWLASLQSAWDALGPEHPGELQLVVVDNSQDVPSLGSLHRSEPRLVAISPPRNLGFGVACNLALSYTSADCIVVILNPDVTVAPDFFVRLSELQWPDDLAARGPRVTAATGEVEQSARRFPDWTTGILGRTSLAARLLPNSRLVRRQLRAAAGAEPFEVDWISGACMIAPRSRFDRIGGFDSRYFMYWEDADWCRRAADSGMRVEFDPTIVVVHAQGVSSGSRPLRTTAAFHLSAFTYHRLHGSRLSLPLAGAALFARFLVKSAATILRARSRSARADIGH